MNKTRRKILEKSVRHAAIVLDFRDRFWWKSVLTSKLNMIDPELSILGQLNHLFDNCYYDFYDNVMRISFGYGIEGSTEEDIEEANMLRIYWNDEIKLRKKLHMLSKHIFIEELDGRFF